MAMQDFVLYWVDKNSKRRDENSEVRYERLLVLELSKSFDYYVQHKPIKGIETVEVAKKKDLKDFMAFLEMQDYVQRAYENIEDTYTFRKPLQNFGFYWLDKNWQRRGDSEAKNEILVVDSTHNCFKHRVTSISPNDAKNTVEVVRKSDIKNFITYLKKQGYREI